MVRAKFRCNAVTKREGSIYDAKTSQSHMGFLYYYEFYVVTGNSGENPENNLFYASTPTGTLTLGAVRDDLFIPGKEYYLDFTEAPKK